MWNVKTNMIPVIIGATGTISKSFRKHLNNRNGKARRTVTTQNSHIWHCTRTYESTDAKYRRFIVGNSITCVIYCNYRIAEILYTVGTRFVSGI
jgi:hypothetical protein